MAELEDLDLQHQLLQRRPQHLWQLVLGQLAVTKLCVKVETVTGLDPVNGGRGEGVREGRGREGGSEGGAREGGRGEGGGEGRREGREGVKNSIMAGTID